MSFPKPEITEVNAPYWEGLADGRLMIQNCGCGHVWLPPSANCPLCLAPDPGWRQAAGTGQVISWTVYHKAYDTYFEGKIPYDVTIVELDEGPRLLSNVVNSGAGARLNVGARVNLAIETEDGVALARFRLTGKEAEK